MSLTATPFGLRVATHVNSDARPVALDGGIASGYASAIYFGSPVTLSTNGTLVVATTTSPICGMFAGVRYQPNTTDMFTVQQNWVASTTFVTGTCTAYIFGYDDPLLVYEIQSNGSIAQTGMGDQANFVNPSSGTGQFSLTTINSSLVGATNTGQLRILDIVDRPDNAWGDSFTRVYVQIAQHQFYAAATAV